MSINFAEIYDVKAVVCGVWLFPVLSADELFAENKITKYVSQITAAALRTFVQ